MESGGLCVFLGARAGQLWLLLVDGGERTAPLPPNVREDVLFLAGECAGLLFLRDLAGDKSERGGPGGDGSLFGEDVDPDV
jgi:hypothetical protein